MKRFLFLLPFLIMLSFLLLFPDTSFTCAASGLMLWFETLLPSLLPFMIISNLLIRTDLLKNGSAYRQACGTAFLPLPVTAPTHCFWDLSAAIPWAPR